MKINITKEQYLEHLDRIPKDLVDAYFANETQDKIDAIAEKYTLLDTQIQRLRENTAWALIGLLHPDSLKDILIKDLGVSMVVSVAIVGDLNHELFIPHKKSITEVLLTYPPKKEWLESTPTTPSQTPKPIAPISPRIAQPIPQQPVNPPTMRPIAAPPLQVARPLGSRPSILEVQRGTDGIRRVPPKNESTAFVSGQAQGPVGGAEVRSAPPVIPPINTTKSDFQQTTEHQYFGSRTSTTPPIIPANSLTREPVNTPTAPQTPHVMFKYVHPEPPAVARVPLQQVQGKPNMSPIIPANSLTREPVNPPQTDTFHETQEEHTNALPVEHAVMDLEEYHQNQGGNVLNLKE